MQIVRRSHLRLQPGGAPDDGACSELLHRLYRECEGRSGRLLRLSRLLGEPGGCLEELFGAMDQLDRRGLVVFLGAGPTISITAQGVVHVEEMQRSA